LLQLLQLAQVSKAGGQLLGRRSFAAWDGGFLRLCIAGAGYSGPAPKRRI